MVVCGGGHKLPAVTWDHQFLVRKPDVPDKITCQWEFVVEFGWVGLTTRQFWPLVCITKFQALYTLFFQMIFDED